MRSYVVTVYTQYDRPDEHIVVAATSREAIKFLRDRARREMWFDRRNNGRVTYAARKEAA